MKKRVAIVGKGPGCGLAPRNKKAVDIWVINNGWVGRDPQSVSMIIDMHNLDWTEEEIFQHYLVHLGEQFEEEVLWDRAERSYGHYQQTKEYCRRYNIPLMSSHTYDCPGFEFPLEKITTKWDTDLFTSGICYAIAFAVWKKYKNLDLFGVNCVKDEEWYNMREAIMMWLGVAKGSGVKVNVTGMEFRPFRAYDKRLYGYNIPQKVRGMPEVDTIVNMTHDRVDDFDVWREA